MNIISFNTYFVIYATGLLAFLFITKSNEGMQNAMYYGLDLSFEKVL